MVVLFQSFTKAAVINRAEGEGEALCSAAARKARILILLSPCMPFKETIPCAETIINFWKLLRT